jgi:hypothetical protein
MKLQFSGGTLHEMHLLHLYFPLEIRIRIAVELTVKSGTTLR